jgi:hypothetical protein
MFFAHIAIPLSHVRTDLIVVIDKLSIESLDTQSLQILEFGHELHTISSLDPSVVQVEVSQVYEFGDERTC